MTITLDYDVLDAATRTGRIFSVEFVKRTTGEARKMVCRRGVTKYLAGGEPAYDFRSHGLMPVWDVQRRDYRCFPVDAVISITVDGVQEQQEIAQ